MERNLSGRCKMGLLRDGNRVYLTLQFDDINDAMAAYDVWSMEDIDMSFKGPKYCVEYDRAVDKPEAPNA